MFKLIEDLGPRILGIEAVGILRGMPDGVRRMVQSRTADRFFRVMRQPFIAAFFFVGLIAFWLVPTIHFRAMIDPRLYLVMNWSMVGDGLLFWAVVLDPRDKEHSWSLRSVSCSSRPHNRTKGTPTVALRLADRAAQPSLGLLSTMPRPSGSLHRHRAYATGNGMSVDVSARSGEAHGRRTAQGRWCGQDDPGY